MPVLLIEGSGISSAQKNAKLAGKGAEYMKKAFWMIVSIVVAVIIVMDISLCISGSLEAFPTAEQIGKGRIVYGLFFVLLIIIEAFILTRIFKKK